MDAESPSPAYETETEGILVRVMPRFLHDESEPAKSRFLWAYTVEIVNRSGATWQLMARHWRIVDAEGRTQMVDGEGVVGQQPVLAPGEVFRYTSGAPLTAPSGVMGGAYDFAGEDGRMLQAVIPTFSLDSPYDKARPS